MTNKFLPFIVETSTPLHVYQTILSRSKGINQLDILSIFAIVLNEDIKDLRAFAKELPDMNAKELYVEIIQKYSSHKVNEEMSELFLILIQEYIDYEKFTDNLSDMSLTDKAGFMCVIAAYGDTRSYCEFDFSRLFSEEKQQILNNVPDHVKFSNSGVAVQITSRIQLMAFILYKAMFFSGSPKTVFKAVRKFS